MGVYNYCNCTRYDRLTIFHVIPRDMTREKPPKAHR